MSKLGSVKSGVDVRRDEDCWMVRVRQRMGWKLGRLLERRANASPPRVRQAW